MRCRPQGRPCPARGAGPRSCWCGPPFESTCTVFRLSALMGAAHCCGRLCETLARGVRRISLVSHLRSEEGSGHSVSIAQVVVNLVPVVEAT
eukprot:6203587-Pleurochrysis_carterae.AAC.1